MNRIRRGLLAAALLLVALPASAAVLSTAPIELSGVNRCLECAVANVGNKNVSVHIEAAAEDGSTTDLGIHVLAPGESAFAGTHCNELGNFTCHFDVGSAARRRIRAMACEFALSQGCAAAAVAE